MIPAPAEALDLFACRTDPDVLWARHSMLVGRTAGILAEATGAVDPSKAAGGGLLHDIGRSFMHGRFHPWLGHQWLMGRGHPAWARCAVTHWLRGRSREEMADSGFRSDFLDALWDRVVPVPLTPLDHVVGVADACARHDELVTIDDRFEDLAVRYRPGPWLDRTRELTDVSVAWVEDAAGRTLAKILGLEPNG